MIAEDFAPAVEQWYAVHGRNLPWRATRDPYRIWISEVILQQTRVEQGLAYYTRFVERFPDVASLAAADEDAVMRLWQGLGYYSRARNLHAAAKAIGNKPFPKTYEEILALKGVGEYTAAAIASIAYDLPYAVVDGNVYRVLARCFGLDTPTDTAKGKKEFSALAGRLLDRQRPGLYNQALMDFGALQCVPLSPQCDNCPLSGGCAALASGKVALLPVKQGKTRIRNRHFVYFVAFCDGKMLIRKRTDADIWHGLWEFPMIETAGAFPDEKSLVADEAVRALFGNAIKEIALLKQGVRHVLTHQRITADFYRVELACGGMPQFEAVEKSDLPAYAFPRLLLPFLP